MSLRLSHASASAALMACLWAATVSPVAAQNSSGATASSAEAPTQLPVSLARIREGLQHESKLLLPFMNPDTPVYRIATVGKTLKLEDYWKVLPQTAVSRDVRPAFASTWHNEFMRMTTPSQQVGASVFGLFGNPSMPVGLPMLTIGKAIKSAWTDRQRGEIRQQIKEELAEIESRPQPQAPQAAAAASSDSSSTPTPATTEPPPAQSPSEQPPAKQTPTRQPANQP